MCRACAVSGPCAIGELGNPQQQVESTRTSELKELNNGRLAMIAVAAYAASEFVAKGMPVD